MANTSIQLGLPWRPFDLSHNTKLRSIHFCDPFPYTRLAQWIDAVARTLKTLTSRADASHLRHLKISLPWRSAHFFLKPQEPNCDHLLRVLGHPLFTNLETLEFSMHATPGRDSDIALADVNIARQMVEERFASCETRYTLRVVVTSHQEGKCRLVIVDCVASDTWLMGVRLSRPSYYISSTS